MHMYIARKNVLEDRAITLILKGEMSFATETSLVPLLSHGTMGNSLWVRYVILMELIVEAFF